MKSYLSLLLVGQYISEIMTYIGTYMYFIIKSSFAFILLFIFYLFIVSTILKLY